MAAGKSFTLFISNEDLNDINQPIESLEKAGLLIHGETEIVKHEMKKQEGRFLRAMIAPMAASLIASMDSSLIQLVASSLINAITVRGQEGDFFSIISITFNDESSGKTSHKTYKSI